MGNILHDWDLGTKKMLINKARAAVPERGALIVVEDVIDDGWRINVPGLLMSLNKLIETLGGYNLTKAEFTGWCLEATFDRFETVPLAGASSALIAFA